MQTFLITLVIAFAAFVGIGLFINWSRRRTARSRHGLSGMCQRTGGTMCSSCQDAIAKHEACPAGERRDTAD